MGILCWQSCPDEPIQLSICDKTTWERKFPVNCLGNILGKGGNCISPSIRLSTCNTKDTLCNISWMCAHVIIYIYILFSTEQGTRNWLTNDFVRYVIIGYWIISRVGWLSQIYMSAAGMSINTANQTSDILWYPKNNECIMCCSCVNTTLMSFICNKHFHNLGRHNNPMW